MAYHKHLEVEINARYDAKTNRHYWNDKFIVLHCHHYTTLFTQLAMDAEFMDGKRLIAECAEDSFHDMLGSYFAARPGLSAADMLRLGCDYYSAIGMGRMEVACWGADSGEVVLHSSHIDQGWVKKWGTHDKPVNHITRGYVAALFSVVAGLPTRRFEVCETDSIVSGAGASRFTVVRL